MGSRTRRRLGALVSAIAVALTTLPMAAPAATGDPVLINEVLASTTGTDVEFVELFGIPGTSLDGLSFIGVESNDGTSLGAIDARIDFGAGDAIGANGFYLAGTSASLQSVYGVTPNLDFATNTLENSSTTYALVETASLTGTTVSGSEVVLDTVGVTDAFCHPAGQRRRRLDGIHEGGAAGDHRARDLTGNAMAQCHVRGLSSE